MNTLSVELIQEIDCQIDDHHAQQAELGKQFFDTFRYDETSGRISTQIRNLQQIVCSATRFTDIADFIKNQMGKTGGEAKKWRGIGEELLKSLDDVAGQARDLTEDPQQQLATRLRLARGWVRAVVSEYLYQVALDQMENEHE